MIVARDTEWKSLPLEALTEHDRPITYGVVKPGEEDRENGVLLVRGGDIRNGRIALNELRTISQDISRPYQRTILRGGELLVSLVGNPGEVAIAPIELVGANIARQAGMIALREDVHTPYVMYFLMSSKGRARMFERTQGAVQQVINLADLKKVEVDLPSLGTQRTIASILSSYDDLIANNQRRMKFLEESVRLIFKEWFVHMRYPGHEHDKIVDGGIPEGWQRTTLDALTTKIGSGATPRGGESSYKTEGITLIRSQNVYDYHFEEAGLAFIDDQQAQQLANVEVQAGDVLLNITGASVGRCCLVPTWCLPARVNQHVMIIRARRQEVSPYYLVCALNSDSRKRHLLSVSSGGVSREALTKPLVSRLEFLLPGKAVLDEFVKLVEVIFYQSDVLERQNRVLIKARELLLPRFMDGRIFV